jgi:hypothetical protein
VPAAIAAAREDLAQVGGSLAWYGVAWAWALRVLLGRLFGEKLRTRRPDQVVPGAVVDWWQVVQADPDHLVLASVGWFCGDGWLGFQIDAAPPGVEQAAAFRPKGLLGLAYWWVLWPVHQLVFRVMVRGRVRRARRARREAGRRPSPPPGAAAPVGPTRAA